MPWEITLINGSVSERRPLGARESVLLALQDAVPGLHLIPAPLPEDKLLESIPPEVRSELTRPKLEADHKIDGLSLYFYAVDAPAIRGINIEVRGLGDPFPVLNAICQQTGWSVIDPAGKIVVDLNTSDDESWTAFCSWRDDAVRRIERDL